MNLLGHNFRLYSADKWVMYYICDNCNYRIEKFSDNEMAHWDWDTTEYQDVISCNDCIIKNIIE
jgi:hypothetical protein